MHIPSEFESNFAKIAKDKLSTIQVSDDLIQVLLFTDKNGFEQKVSIPQYAIDLMLEILSEFEQGNAVSLTQIPKELSIQQCADFLNVSRLAVLKLIEKGSIPSSGEGKQRKIKLSDIVTYKDTQLEQAIASLDELSAIDQELRLY